MGKGCAVVQDAGALIELLGWVTGLLVAVLCYLYHGDRARITRLEETRPTREEVRLMIQGG